MNGRKYFGTDGIRGTANMHPMTPEIALKAGKAITKFLQVKEKSVGRRVKIVIGKDTRRSGYMIESALTSGICSMGGTVLLVGPMPTPGIAHLTKSLNADAGIMLTASHNPAEDNGIKIFGRDGFKLPDGEEKEIEELMEKENLNENESAVEENMIIGDDVGKAFRIDDAKGRYIEFAKSTIGNKDLSGIKIVIDCANGAAYSMAGYIFSELGAEVILIGDKPDGMNINFECGAMHPEKMQELVVKEKADIGIALDGDADRIIVCDENGKLLTGDQIIAITALEMKGRDRLKNNAVAVTVMSNSGFKELMESNGIHVEETQVGDKYVIERMREKDIALGGENSGHIIFMKHASTGDGIISGLQLLKVVKKNGKKLSELKQVMEEYPNEMINVKVKEKKEFEEIPGLLEKVNETKNKLMGKGKVIVRYSGTENLCRVFVEGKNEEEIKGYAKEIAELIENNAGDDSS